MGIITAINCRGALLLCAHAALICKKQEAAGGKGEVCYMYTPLSVFALDGQSCKRVTVCIITISNSASNWRFCCCCCSSAFCKSLLVSHAAKWRQMAPQDIIVIYLITRAQLRYNYKSCSRLLIYALLLLLLHTFPSLHACWCQS
jgi:hypothetical protein